MIEYLGSAVIGFLFAVGAAVTWWQGRHKRAHYRYWNGRT